MVRRTEGPEDTIDLGRALGRAALPLPPGGLTVALHGDLGAGKTVFVKGAALGIGIPASTRIVSPTFTIARSYEAPGTGISLHHVDAYRLGGEAEVEAAGFEEMRGDGVLTCVEWAERVAPALPADRLEVTLALDTAHAPSVPPGAEPRAPRVVRLRATGPGAARVLERLAGLLGREAR
jgi:tRNA threonylcarbamoyladenosine biosynthesis protein TsaE